MFAEVDSGPTLDLDARPTNRRVRFQSRTSKKAFVDVCCNIEEALQKGPSKCTTRRYNSLCAGVSFPKYI